jgi:maltose alpha-D-glucosyltransferase/alpha-amylase
VEVLEAVPIRFGAAARVTLVHTEYADGEPETYVLPLMLTRDGDPQRHLIPEGAIVARVPSPSGEGILYDASFDPEFGKALLEMIWHRSRHPGISGTIVGAPASSMRDEDRNIGAPEPGKPGQFEQSNTSIVFGREMILKLFRRAEKGINTDVEIGRFLTESAAFAHVPEFLGTLEYQPTRGEPVSLAILQRFVPNEGDAWTLALDALAGYFERALLAVQSDVLPPPSRGVSASLAPPEPPALVRELIGPYLASARTLGVRSAEMHIALASTATNPAFAPEQFTAQYQSSLRQSIQNQTRDTLALLRERQDYLTPEVSTKALQLLDREHELLARLDVLLQGFNAVRIRCHGDYHLGQVLCTGDDFMIIDFEGEPARTIGERRIKRSPLRDVAGMLRSFVYAAQAAMNLQFERGTTRSQAAPRLASLAQIWSDWVSVAFLHAYLRRVEGTPAWPAAPLHLNDLLAVHVIEKAVYELKYELNTRPLWAGIPVANLLQLATSGR